MDPVPPGEPTPPRRVLPCDPRRVPAHAPAGRPHAPRRAHDICRGYVPTALLDTARRPHRRGHPRARLATHRSFGRGGKAPMRAIVVLCTTLAVAAACQPVDRKRQAANVADTTHPVDTTRVVPPPLPPPAPGATKMLTVAGFSTPESVLHDSTQDIYFVSNVNGSPTAKDDNGFISRVRPDGAVENLKFIEGGKNGVTLHGPKGLALWGDTLWVADIDAVRGFNARTGASIDSVSLASLGAVFLNDIAIAPTGALYITDTGIRFDDVGNVLHPGPDRVFRIGPDRKVTVAVRGDTLGRPNGIALDPVGKRFVIVEFGGRSLLAWKPEDKAPSVIAKGPGGFDGVVIAGGKILVSSWTDSTVSSYETGQAVKLVTGVPSPADIGYDAKRNRLLIPIFTGNRVEIWQLP